MKKIKFLALTALFCAMGLNVMAADDTTWANRTFRYTYDSSDTDAGATIIGFVNDYPTGDMATVTIPATVTQKDNGEAIKVVAIADDAFKDNKNIKKVIFSSSNLKTVNAAFGGCTALEEVDFTAATKVAKIAANAFAKAPIKKLDLSKTIITTVDALLGNKIVLNGGKPDPENGHFENKSLTEVKLPESWTTMTAGAFNNCTALATVDFGKAKNNQTLNAAFQGCPITELNFTDTKITSLPANLLYDGTLFTKNESLTSVTLKSDFTQLNAALSNCVNLATLTGYIKDAGKPAATSALTTLVNNEFQNDAKLTSFDFSLVKKLGDYAFAGTGLTEVKFAKDKIADIPEGCFMDCASLATVTWDKADATLETIGEKAFAGTAIASITFPKGAKFDVAGTNKIAANAFAACENLNTVIWDDQATTVTGKWITQSAFAFCDAVNFYTSAAEIAFWDGTTNKVDNVTFKNINEAPGTVAEKLTMTAYKNGSGKYYYKMKAAANIAILKGDAKVYSAYADAADDAVLNMISYKPEKGKYQIANGDICLIVSEKAEVELAEYNGTGSGSMASKFDAVGKNALKMNAAATTRLSLLLDAPADTYSLYGWVNSANGTGFQKITTGTNIPANTLYAYAKEPAAGGRLIVKWYDENGNLEGETTGIQSVEAQAAEAEGESFNLSGQKVAAGYKGIVIKNGKKMIVK